MNKSVRKLMLNFLISVVFAVLASLVLLLIPLNSGGERNVLLILTGAFFWLIFIISQVSFWQANNLRKTILKCSKKRKVKKPDDSLGIISFCKNKPACIADGILIISVIILVIVLCFNMKNPWLIITDVSFLFLSFNLHCMLNGRNFQYIRCFEKSIESKER